VQADLLDAAIQMPRIPLQGRQINNEGCWVAIAKDAPATKS